jgi:hypothetical protein
MNMNLYTVREYVLYMFKHVSVYIDMNMKMHMNRKLNMNKKI